MKNSKIKSIRNFNNNNNRNSNYKAISFASLSVLVLPFTLGNTTTQAMMGKGGSIKFFGSSGSRVITPGSMGSTGVGKVNYPKVGATTGGIKKPPKPTPGPDGKVHTSKFYLTFGPNGFKPGKPTGNAGSGKTPTPPKPSTSNNVTSPNNSNKPSTSTGGNTTNKPSTSNNGGGSSSNTLNKKPLSGTSNNNGGNTSNPPSRPPSLSGSNNGDNTYDAPDNTNTGRGKLTKKQKVGIIAGGSGLGLLALAGVGIGVGVATNNNGGGNNGSSNKTPGPESIPTPEKPSNTTKVAQSGAGFNYFDEKA